MCRSIGREKRRKREMERGNCKEKGSIGWEKDGDRIMFEKEKKSDVGNKARVHEI